MIATFVLLNPSPIKTSPVPKKLEKWTRGWSTKARPLGGFEIVNLLPLVTSNVVEAVSPFFERLIAEHQGGRPHWAYEDVERNWVHVRAAVKQDGPTICAWGTKAFLAASESLGRFIDEFGSSELFCIERLHGGDPKHPRFINHVGRLRRFTPRSLPGRTK